MQSCPRTKERLAKEKWRYNKNMDSQFSEGNELAKLTPESSNEVHKSQWHLDWHLLLIITCKRNDLKKIH